MLETRADTQQRSWLRLACPVCASMLDDSSTCDRCGLSYALVDGIWRCMRPERQARFDQFLSEYQAVRRAEGWGADDDAYYRELPWRDLSGRFKRLWRIRAASFKLLVCRVVEPMERRRGGPLRVLDLGAGNCWLSYRLAQRGHQVASLDLLTDAVDGLGAWRHYDAELTPIQAEFDALPLADGQFDLAIFNASLHYSTDCTATVSHALRVLRRDGTLVILDSPVYFDPVSGRRMVRERQARFRETYGFASDGLACEHFLTPARLDEIGQQLGLRWRAFEPFNGMRWALRPWVARLRGQREPARFFSFVGRRV